MKIEIETIRRDDQRNYLPIIMMELKKRFKTEEDFENRIDTYCLEIAMQLNAEYFRQGHTCYFDFSKTYN
jgi:hypothetical protein